MVVMEKRKRKKKDERNERFIFLQDDNIRIKKINKMI